MLLIAALIVALIGAASYQEGRDRAAAAAELRITRRIRDLTARLLATLTDAEAGQRGYLITGREEYLAPYHTAVSAVSGILAELRSASEPRPGLTARVSALEPVVAARLKQLQETVSIRQSGGLFQAEQVVKSDRGKVLMDDVRARCDAILAITDGRTASLSTVAERSANRLSLVSTLGSLLLLGFLGLSALTIFRGMVRREDLYRQAHSNAEHLRVTLTSIGDAVIATDEAACVTFINPVAARLIGWTESEAISRPIQSVFDIVNEVTREPVENPVMRALATGTVVGLANHTVLVDRNGGEVPIDDSGAPIRDDQGAIVGAILVFRDISERRASERQLKESNEQLKQFVAAAAHDLRSPLHTSTAIAQMLEARCAERLGGEGKQLIGYITSGLARMSRLLEDLLAYAQAGHFEPEAGEKTAIAAALDAVLDNLRMEIEVADARVTAGSLPTVHVSETHLVQLLQNLIGNALKYRSAAPPYIRVGAQKRGCECTLTVADNGIGIEPEFVGEIFKPFRRLHGHDHPGSGIGLATCQRIAAGYRGRIWVESEPGRGSTFFVTLPAADDSRAAGT